jgi:phospholipid/cholesterol/gamma-HCH transport system ATP-binding protein
MGIVGKSGSGKSTLMREILMLQRPDSGSVRVFGHELMTASSETLIKIEHRWGVLFQHNALFSSLNLIENVKFPLREHGHLNNRIINDLALQKITSVGLEEEASVKYPSELSGGMQKRAALARAMVLEPELLFLDEPTSALDPESAASLDDLILDLQSALNLTVVIVTHDLDTLWRVTNRVAFIDQGKVLCVDSMEKLVKNPNQAIQSFFNGPRGRTAENIYGNDNGN